MQPTFKDARVIGISDGYCLLVDDDGRLWRIQIAYFSGTPELVKFPSADVAEKPDA